MRQLYLSLLRSGITGAPIHLPDPLPDKEAQGALYRLAYSHDMAHFVGAELEKAGFSMEEKVKTAFTNVRIKALYRYTRLWHGFDQILALFERHALPSVPLKGAVLRHLYPTPEMRTSSDIDLLVPEERLEEAVSLLTGELGFTEKGRTYHDVHLVMGDAVNLELHYNITEDDPILDPLLEEAWQHASPKAGGAEHVFDDAYFAFHIVAHACSHFLRGGCGTKVIMDMYLLSQSPTFDADAVRALCHKCGIDRFFDALLLLSRVWFGDAEHTETTLGMEDLILGGGAFGSISNRTAIGTAKRNRLRYALDRIFIPRRRLARLYPSLLKYPFLLPLFHIRRWFRVIFRGRGKNAVGELTSTATMPKEKRKALAHLLSDLGL